MLEGNRDVRERITMPARPGAGGTLRWARRLWRRYDLALIADPGDRAHLIGAIAAPVRSGILPAQNRSNWWKRRLLAHAVTSAGDGLWIDAKTGAIRRLRVEIEERLRDACFAFSPDGNELWCIDAEKLRVLRWRAPAR